MYISASISTLQCVHMGYNILQKMQILFYLLMILWVKEGIQTLPNLRVGRTHFRRNHARVERFSIKIEDFMACGGGVTRTILSLYQGISGRG